MTPIENTTARRQSALSRHHSADVLDRLTARPDRDTPPVLTDEQAAAGRLLRWHVGQAGAGVRANTALKGVTMSVCGIPPEHMESDAKPSRKARVIISRLPVRRQVKQHSGHSEAVHLRASTFDFAALQFAPHIAAYSDSLSGLSL